MNKIILVIGSLCLLSLVVLPAQAFTAKDLTITLARDGSADVVFTYDLSAPEYFAVFLNIADPAKELKNGLEESLQTPVTVVHTDSGSMEVTIHSFAQVTGSGNAVTETTPSLSFAKAQDAINKYWFAPLISPDLSPAVTRVIFPDGYSATFSNEISIPSVSHLLTV